MTDSLDADRQRSGDLEFSEDARQMVAVGSMANKLWLTGDGLCLLAKYLERGRFVWPQADSGKVHLTPAQLSMLLEGINW